jgi:hypothetical protein
MGLIYNPIHINNRKIQHEEQLKPSTCQEAQDVQSSRLHKTPGQTQQIKSSV